MFFESRSSAKVVAHAVAVWEVLPPAMVVQQVLPRVAVAQEVVLSVQVARGGVPAGRPRQNGKYSRAWWSRRRCSCESRYKFADH